MDFRVTGDHVVLADDLLVKLGLGETMPAVDQLDIRFSRIDPLGCAVSSIDSCGTFLVVEYRDVQSTFANFILAFRAVVVARAFLVDDSLFTCEGIIKREVGMRETLDEACERRIHIEELISTSER
jgi:hypothetical protein